MRTYRPILAVVMAVIMILSIGSIAMAKPQGDKPANNCVNSQTHKVADHCTCSITQTCGDRCQCGKKDKDKKDNNCPKPDKVKFGSIAGYTVLDTITTATTIYPTLAKAHLRLLTSDCKKVVRAAQADKNGCFTFKNVKPGPYKLSGWLKGYKLVSTVSVTVTASGKCDTIVHFKKCLKKPAHKCTKK
ncbi:MAG: SpaA isopeptide-forming pilin-related protein [Candidatus Aquicultor sp.]